MGKKAAVIIILAILLLGSLAAAVVSATNVNSCQTLSAADTYTLTTDVSTSSICFKITANSVNLNCQGHTISYDSENGNAVLFNQSNFSSVSNCNFTNLEGSVDANFAVSVLKSLNASILNNNFSLNFKSGGIKVEDTISKNTTIINNSMINMGNGIAGITLLSSNNVVHRNSFVDNLGASFYTVTGISLSSSSSNIISNNSFFSNFNGGLNQHNLVAIDACSSNDNNLITNNMMTSLNGGSAGATQGIGIGGDNNIIQNNTILTSDGTDLAIYWACSGIRNNTIRYNNINTEGTEANFGRQRGTGISLANDINTSIHDNGILAMSRGIYLSSSTGAIIFNNNITIYGDDQSWSSSGQTGGGIILSTSQLINVTRNSINSSGFSRGIFLTGTKNSTISNNTVNTTYFGAYIVEGTNIYDFNHSVDSFNLAKGLPINYSYALDNLEFRGLNFSSYGQVIVASSKNFTAYNNSFYNDGLSVFNVTGANITSNLFINPKSAGLTASSLINFTAFNNYMKNTAVGLFLADTRLGNIYTNILNLTSHTALMEGTIGNNTFYNNLFNISVFQGITGTNNWNTTKTTATNIVGKPFIGGNYYGTTGISKTCTTDNNVDYICDSSSTIASSNIDYLPLIDGDAVIPVPSIVSPANATYTNISSINITCNTSDNNFLANNSVFVLNSTNNFIYNNTVNISGTLNQTNFTLTFPTVGTFLVACRVSDVYGNLNSTQNLTLRFDNSTPQLAYGERTENGSYINKGNIYINVSISDDFFANMNFSLYNSSASLIRVLNFSTTTASVNMTDLPLGFYEFNVTARDLAGNINHTSTRNITLALPQVTVNTPEEGETLSAAGSPINTTLNYTIENATSNNICYFNATNPLATQQNTTIVGCSENITTFLSLAGTFPDYLHTVNFCINNSFGHTSCLVRTFTASFQSSIVVSGSGGGGGADSKASVVALLKPELDTNNFNTLSRAILFSRIRNYSMLYGAELSQGQLTDLSADLKQYGVTISVEALQKWVESYFDNLVEVVQVTEQQAAQYQLVKREVVFGSEFAVNPAYINTYTFYTLCEGDKEKTWTRDVKATKLLQSCTVAEGEFNCSITDPSVARLNYKFKEGMETVTNLEGEIRYVSTEKEVKFTKVQYLNAVNLCGKVNIAGLRVNLFIVAIVSLILLVMLIAFVIFIIRKRRQNRTKRLFPKVF